MKTSIFTKLILVATLIFATSCEKVSIHSPETSLETRTPLSLKLIPGISPKADNLQLPQTIQELRDAGVPVSVGLANFLSNDLGILLQVIELEASTLSRLGFYESEIVEFEEIKTGYDRLVFLIENGGTIAPDPGPLSRVQNASYVLGIWKVESFRINGSAGADQLLTDDLSRISDAPEAANGFEVSATEFKFTKDGAQIGDVYPVVEINRRGRIKYLKNNKVTRFFEIAIRNQDGDIFGTTSLVPAADRPILGGRIVHHRFRRQ